MFVIPRNNGLCQLFEVITWSICCFVNTIIERFENTDDFILFADKFFLGRPVDDDLTETMISFKVHSCKTLKKGKATSNFSALASVTIDGRESHEINFLVFYCVPSLLTQGK